MGLVWRLDIILTSDTIYSLELQPKLLNALKQPVRPMTGVVYVAAKTFYFGVGGSTSPASRGGWGVLVSYRGASVHRVTLKLTQRS